MTFGDLRGYHFEHECQHAVFCFWESGRRAAEQEWDSRERPRGPAESSAHEAQVTYWTRVFSVYCSAACLHHGLFTLHLFVLTSQTEGPVVTAAGHIEMRAFSVTKKVSLFGLVQFNLCRLFMYIDIYWTVEQMSLQRDTSDSIEASIVLSGTFIPFWFYSLCMWFQQLWLNMFSFPQVFWTPCRNQWWPSSGWVTLLWWTLSWRLLSPFASSSWWWAPAKAGSITASVAEPWVLSWLTGWEGWQRRRRGRPTTASSRRKRCLRCFFTGVLSGGVLSPDWKRRDQRHRRIHGLQHRDSPHRDPGNVNAGTCYHFPAEDAARQAPSLRHSSGIWRKGQRSEKPINNKTDTNTWMKSSISLTNHRLLS